MLQQVCYRWLCRAAATEFVSLDLLELLWRWEPAWVNCFAAGVLLGQLFDGVLLK